MFIHEQLQNNVGNDIRSLKQLSTPCEEKGICNGKDGKTGYYDGLYIGYFLNS